MARSSYMAQFGGYTPGSSRFGQVGLGDLTISALGKVRPGTSVRFEANQLIHLTDQITNYFRGGPFQQALSSVHARATEVVARGMVERLEQRVDATGRPQRGTDWLEVSLLHERNVDWTANTFIVGRPSWLDQSPAKLYYRRIEEGDPHTFVARALFTNFNGPPGRAGGPPGYQAPWRGPFVAPGSGLHLRMPQFTNKGPLIPIGPYPAYKYSEGGRDALDRMNIAREYQTALAAVGIRMSDVRRTVSKK